jgi:hypothetical protein
MLRNLELNLDLSRILPINAAVGGEESFVKVS